MLINNLIAAGVNPNPPGSVVNPAFQGSALEGFNSNVGGVNFFQAILPNAIGLCFVVGSLIFFFMIVMGAIQWIASGGDKQGLESARGKISNAIIGIIILFSTFAIVKLIETFFGINILTIDIGPLVIQ